MAVKAANERQREKDAAAQRLKEHREAERRRIEEEAKAGEEF